MTAFVPQADEVLPVIGALAIVAVMYGVFGLICAVVAPGRGRSAVAWFFIGFFTQCIGVILVFLLPDLKVEAEKQRRREEETRKLRELLKKERQVADHRHDSHRTRLGVHDRALGIDTSAAEDPALLSAEEPPPLPPSLPPPAAPEWFYASEGRQQGPVPAAKLRQLWIDGRIDDQALVWRDGMNDWAAITEVVDLLDDRGEGTT